MAAKKKSSNTKVQKESHVIPGLKLMYWTKRDWLGLSRLKRRGMLAFLVLTPRVRVTPAMVVFQMLTVTPWKLNWPPYVVCETHLNEQSENDHNGDVEQTPTRREGCR